MTSNASEELLLAVNGGSSSVKFAVFRRRGLARVVSGAVEDVGSEGAILALKRGADPETEREPVRAADSASCARLVADVVAREAASGRVSAIGHRIVHGGARHRAASRIDEPLLADLRGLVPLDPEHLPGELRLIEACARAWPGTPQVACFDTSFHRDMPPVARLFPIPRRYFEKGVARLGFHGLSYASLRRRLAQAAGSAAADGRVVLAHLGHGASLAALFGGKSIDTTMGFTPAAGIPMGTRSGDLDPGLAGFLARDEAMSTEAFDRMTTRESGLLGLSETTSDMRELLARENGDRRAADAIAVFCYSIRKAIGGLAAALGGLDTLVFSGGIGERSPIVRERVCERLGFLGVALDIEANARSAAVISRSGARAVVRVIATDEESEIAREVVAVLDQDEVRRGGGGA